MSTPASREFAPDTAADLRRSGWTIVEIPAGLTLALLRQHGAPFRGDRYFRDLAARVVEAPTRTQSVAYRPAILPGSLNRRYDECEELLAGFNRSVPVGCRAIIGQAAVYVQILWCHCQATGEFPLAGGYTWASETYPEGHLVVGVFGRERPLVVGPHPKSGRGIGVMPLIVPAEGG
ncbi:MAG TPA: hypothetical protein VNL16_16875 [Chloroflexota bacterium]|nr:hypothetical protein [Chloroflexota bacterium]